MNNNAIKIDSAQDYLDKVIASLHTLDRREKGPLVQILEYISIYIRASREEIWALRHGADSQASFSTAADELEEIVAESAAATNAIMNAAESIEAAGAELSDEALADRLRQDATRIYEACTFQDITGQRIAKVVRTLQSIESRVNALVAVCGSDGAPGANGGPSGGDAEKLLNGPQLPATAKTQDEIDRLFESL